MSDGTIIFLVILGAVFILPITYEFIIELVKKTKGKENEQDN